MARQTRMARTPTESRLRLFACYVETDRAGRGRTARESQIAKRKAARSGEDQMNRSRRRNCNTVNAASLARWIVMTAFLALAGLAYVYLTLQLYHLGERRKAVENELVKLRTQNDEAAGQIAALTSRTALQRQLKQGYLKMIPVSDSKIVRLTIPARSTDEEAIQPVVNPLPQHESKKPNSLRSGVCCFYRPVQHLF